jgi:hypothetical protein
VIWKPSFMAMHGKQARLKVVKKVGNKLTLLRGERVEWAPRGALPAREIKRMMKNQMGEREGVQGQPQNANKGEAEKKRETFAGVISVEGEFTFTKAVGAFCREAKKMGNF